MGVAYSLLASALWPIAALIIPEYQLGTAYGLMQVISSLLQCLPHRAVFAWLPLLESVYSCLYFTIQIQVDCTQIRIRNQTNT